MVGVYEARKGAMWMYASNIWKALDDHNDISIIMHN